MQWGPRSSCSLVGPSSPQSAAPALLGGAAAYGPQQPTVSNDVEGTTSQVSVGRGLSIESGRYAECIGLAREKGPGGCDAIRIGSVLEYVAVDESTGTVDFEVASPAENTRVAYPLEFIPDARIPEPEVGSVIVQVAYANKMVDLQDSLGEVRALRHASPASAGAATSRPSVA